MLDEQVTDPAGYLYPEHVGGKQLLTGGRLPLADRQRGRKDRRGGMDDRGVRVVVVLDVPTVAIDQRSVELVQSLVTTDYRGLGIAPLVCEQVQQHVERGIARSVQGDRAVVHETTLREVHDLGWNLVRGVGLHEGR